MVYSLEWLLPHVRNAIKAAPSSPPTVWSTHVIATLIDRIDELEEAAQAVVDTDARHCGRIGVRESVLALAEILKKGQQ
jgi:hypothetical protein